jgi:hypothetical protein
MILIDAHVHLHECFAPERFLDAAANNMRAAARGMGLSDSTPGMLLFTQIASDDSFGGLTPGSVGNWSLAPTQEAISLSARRAGAPPLILVAGRQIATAEGLEVLALGTPGPFANGKPVETTIKAVREQDGVPVLPWGFGKWWGKRGAVVRRLINDHARFPLLFLGDSAGRPGIGPRPGLFAEAGQQHRAVLPGTDPLPLPGEVEKVGRLVFRVDNEIDAEKPFAGLKYWLTCCEVSPPAFGSYERPSVFLRRQIGTQFRKRQRATC